MKNKIIEALEEIFWFPATYLFFITFLTIVMILLIINSGLKGFNFYLLFIFPVGFVISSLVIYSIKMKYGKVY